MPTFKNIKPMPNSGINARLDHNFIGLAYWTRPKSASQAFPHAHLAVHFNMALEAGLALKQTDPYICAKGSWALLHDEAAALYRVELVPSWELGYSAKPYSRIFLKIAIPIRPGMVLPEIEGDLMIRNAKVEDGGINFSIFSALVARKAQARLPQILADAEEQDRKDQASRAAQ